MVVVSNTSPLTNLAAIGQFDLLKGLFGELDIPSGVWHELNAQEKRWPGCEEVESAEWIHRRPVNNLPLVQELGSNLGTGEAEAIALALELSADWILLDEKDGRHKAERLGLAPLGVVGVLIAAKGKGLIAEVRPHLDALRNVAGFYLADAVYEYALDQVKEA